MAVAVRRVPHPGHPRLGEAGAAGVGVETGIATIPGGARLHALLQALRRKALLRQAVLAATYVFDFEPMLSRRLNTQFSFHTPLFCCARARHTFGTVLQ